MKKRLPVWVGVIGIVAFLFTMATLGVLAHDDGKSPSTKKVDVFKQFMEPEPKKLGGNGNGFDSTVSNYKTEKLRCRIFSQRMNATSNSTLTPTIRSLQSRVNEWLKDNHYRIVSILQSTSNTAVVITIFYKK